MSEIKLDTEKHDIDDLIRYLHGDHHMGVHDRWQLVKDIVAQMPKSAVEEPEPLWSVIFANVPGSRFLEPKQLVKSKAGWLDEDGNGWGDFSGFTDVEVLRVGLGEPELANAEAGGYAKGYLDGARGMNDNIHHLLLKLLAAAITGERKNAFEKAIQAVEELAP